MNKIKNIIVVGSLIFSFIGCVATPITMTKMGNQAITNENVMSQIIPRKTDKATVVSLLGRPSYSYMMQGREVWVYNYIETKTNVLGKYHGPFETQMTGIQITFDPNGVICNVSGQPN